MSGGPKNTGWRGVGMARGCGAGVVMGAGVTPMPPPAVPRVEPLVAGAQLIASPRP